VRNDQFLTLPVPELPRAHHVTRGYYTSAYFTVGPNDGRPLVLCHGLAANGLQFVDDAHAYAQMGFRVIVPDLRGHGRSKMPDKKFRRNEDFTIKAMADDLVAILDVEQVDQVNWVGNSLGGVLALSLMGTNPLRLSRFICFGTSFSMNMAPFSLKLMRFVSRLVRREHLNQIGARLAAPDPEAHAIIYAMLKDADRDCIVRIARNLQKYDLIENALSFDRAMLMIRGGRDTGVNRMLAPTLGAMNGHSYFFVRDLEDVGHLANLDQPQTVRKAIVDFIGSRTGRMPGSREL